MHDTLKSGIVTGTATLLGALVGASVLFFSTQHQFDQNQDKSNSDYVRSQRQSVYAKFLADQSSLYATQRKLYNDMRGLEAAAAVTKADSATCNAQTDGLLLSASSINIFAPRTTIGAVIAVNDAEQGLTNTLTIRAEEIGLPDYDADFYKFTDDANAAFDNLEKVLGDLVAAIKTDLGIPR